MNFENNFELNTGYNSLGFTVVLSCKGTGIGEIEPGGAGQIVEFAVPARECKGVGSLTACKEVEMDSAADVPWEMELYKEGSEVRNRIVKEESAWRFKCANTPPFG